MTNPTRAYLLIHGRLYLAANLDTTRMKHGNLYPGALGEWCGQDSLLPAGTVRAAHGDTLALFGRRYEVNSLPTHGDCDDDIDLELVLLTRRDDPAADDFCWRCAACGAITEDAAGLTYTCPCDD